MPENGEKHQEQTTETRFTADHGPRKSLLGAYHEIAATLFSLENTANLEEHFLAAARDGDADKVQHFLQRRTNEFVNIDGKDKGTGNTALIWAVKRGHTRIVQLLLKYGADVTLRNYESKSAVELASPAIRHVLLESVDRMGCTHRHLLQAAWQGNFEIVRKLLETKTLDINCQNTDGFSPLHLAVRDCHLFEKLSAQLKKNYNPCAVLKELLEYRADVHAADEDGKSPIHYASLSKCNLSSHLVAILLNDGSSHNARDRRCYTPIHCASQTGNIDVVKTLIDGGSEVNSRAYAGYTPLHVTAIHGHEKVATTLLNHGADVTLVDDSGLTPVDVAKNKKVKTTLKEAWIDATQQKVEKVVLKPVRPPTRESTRMSFDESMLQDYPLSPKTPRKGDVFEGNASDPTGRKNTSPPSNRRPEFGQRQMTNAEKAKRAEEKMMQDIESGRFTPAPTSRDAKAKGLAVPQSGMTANPPKTPERNLAPIKPNTRAKAKRQQSYPAYPDISNPPSRQEYHTPVTVLSFDQSDYSPTKGPFLEKRHAPGGTTDASATDLGSSLDDYIFKGRTSSKTYLEDLEDVFSPPPRLTPLTSSTADRVRLNIPDTITESDQSYKEGQIFTFDKRTLSAVSKGHPLPSSTFITQQDGDGKSQSQDGKVKMACADIQELIRGKSILKDDFKIEDSRLTQVTEISPDTSTSLSSLSSPSSEEHKPDIQRKLYRSESQKLLGEDGKGQGLKSGRGIPRRRSEDSATSKLRQAAKDNAALSSEAKKGSSELPKDNIKSDKITVHSDLLGKVYEDGATRVEGGKSQTGAKSDKHDGKSVAAKVTVISVKETKKTDKDSISNSSQGAQSKESCKGKSGVKLEGSGSVPNSVALQKQSGDAQTNSTAKNVEQNANSEKTPEKDKPDFGSRRSKNQIACHGGVNSGSCTPKPVPTRKTSKGAIVVISQAPTNVKEAKSCQPKTQVAQGSVNAPNKSCGSTANSENKTANSVNKVASGEKNPEKRTVVIVKKVSKEDLNGKCSQASSSKSGTEKSPRQNKCENSPCQFNVSSEKSNLNKECSLRQSKEKSPRQDTCKDNSQRQEKDNSQRQEKDNSQRQEKGNSQRQSKDNSQQNKDNAQRQIKDNSPTSRQGKDSSPRLNENSQKNKSSSGNSDSGKSIPVSSSAEKKTSANGPSQPTRKCLADNSSSMKTSKVVSVQPKDVKAAEKSDTSPNGSGEGASKKVAPPRPNQPPKVASVQYEVVEPKQVKPVPKNSSVNVNSKSQLEKSSVGQNSQDRKVVPQPSKSGAVPTSSKGPTAVPLPAKSTSEPTMSRGKTVVQLVAKSDANASRVSKIRSVANKSLVVLKSTSGEVVLTSKANDVLREASKTVASKLERAIGMSTTDNGTKSKDNLTSPSKSSLTDSQVTKSPSKVSVTSDMQSPSKTSLATEGSQKPENKSVVIVMNKDKEKQGKISESEKREEAAVKVTITENEEKSSMPEQTPYIRDVYEHFQNPFVNKDATKLSVKREPTKVARGDSKLNANRRQPSASKSNNRSAKGVRTDVKPVKKTKSNELAVKGVGTSTSTNSTQKGAQLPKSGKGNKRKGKKKKKKDDKLELERDLTRTAFISGIGWHVAADCNENTDVEAVGVIDSDSESDVDQSEALSAVVDNNKNLLRLSADVDEPSSYEEIIQDEVHFGTDTDSSKYSSLNSDKSDPLPKPRQVVKAFGETGKDENLNDISSKLELKVKENQNIVTSENLNVGKLKENAPPHAEDTSQKSSENAPIPQAEYVETEGKREPRSSAEDTEEEDRRLTEKPLQRSYSMRVKSSEKTKSSDRPLKRSKTLLEKDRKRLQGEVMESKEINKIIDEILTITSDHSTLNDSVTNSLRRRSSLTKLQDGLPLAGGFGPSSSGVDPSEVSKKLQNVKQDLNDEESNSKEDYVTLPELMNVYRANNAEDMVEKITNVSRKNSGAENDLAVPNVVFEAPSTKTPQQSRKTSKQESNNLVIGIQKSLDDKPPLPDRPKSSAGKSPRSAKQKKQKQVYKEVKTKEMYGSKESLASTFPSSEFYSDHFSLPGSEANTLTEEGAGQVIDTRTICSRLGRRSAASQCGSTCTNDSISSEDVICWKKGNMLGRGAYGTVWCGLTDHGELIAIKQIEMNTVDKVKAEKEYEKIQEEVEMLKTLRHKNIVGFYGTSLDEHTVGIFMEYVPGGSIANVLARFGALEEAVFSIYTKQILEGVEYIHNKGVIHRDIKGGNIMLTQDGIIKLIDFGCAKRLCLNSSISQGQLLKSMRGTPYWMAPEVVAETGHGKKSDIWSIGCTVFEMATRKPPWADMNPMAAIFAIGGTDKSVPELDASFSHNARDFVSSCLCRDVEKRPHASELLLHPFIAKNSRKIKRRSTMSAHGSAVWNNKKNKE